MRGGKGGFEVVMKGVAAEGGHWQCTLDLLLHNFYQIWQHVLVLGIAMQMQEYAVHADYI